jgi:16S rRNA (cytidine1402-2'-O)-methyltransferase
VHTGTLYLVPTPLDFGCAPEFCSSVSEVLPEFTVATAARLSHWITENAKSTRAFLARVNEIHPLKQPVQALTITALPRQVHKKGDHGPATSFDARPLLAAALAGSDMGLVSEAGMPAIADPGASVVRAAHDLGIPVHPLVGPVSLVLALAASGLNGQHFAFVGYLPQEPDRRLARLRELEQSAHKTGQTQIFIETPYRNSALLQAAVQHLRPETRLAVACGLTLNRAAPANGAPAGVHSAPVHRWRSNPPVGLVLDHPAVFLIGP